MATFEPLVAESLNAPCSGWDFSWLAPQVSNVCLTTA
jgi:hypothetical protein